VTQREKAIETIRNYILALEEENFSKFEINTYSESEELKKLCFDSLILAIQLNKKLKRKYGPLAIEDFNLYKKHSYIGISDLPVKLDYDKLNDLKFRKHNGKIGIFDPQTHTFFTFKKHGDRLMVNLQEDVIDMAKYINLIKESIQFMNHVIENVNAGKAEGKTIKEFAKEYTYEGQAKDAVIKVW